MLYFKLYPFTLLKQSRSLTFFFMYLGELLQYYQSSNNLPQSAQNFDFDLKSCIVLLNTSSRSTRCWLSSVSLFVALVCLGPRVVLLVVDLSPSQSLLLWFGLLRTLSRSAVVVDLSPSQSLLLWFGLLGTSSHSTRCRLVSASLFVALVSLGPRVALLVVVLSPSQSFMLCVAQHLELLCSFLTCLHLNLSSSALLSTLSRSARCRLVSVSIFATLVCSTPGSWSAHCWFVSTVETVCFNLSCFVKPRLALLAVQLSMAGI